MKTSLIRLSILVMILTLVLSACSESESAKPKATFDEVTTSTTGPNFGKEPKVAPGFDGSTISLGVITPLSGLPGFLGNAITDGAQTYWDAKNETGGVAGKYKVELKKEDSSKNGTYDKTLSINAYDKLSKEVVAFQSVLGSDVVLSLKDKQIEDSMLIAPATLSGSWVKNPLVLPITNPYQTQAINGIQYFVDNFEGSNPKICTLALDDSFGDDGVKGVEFAVDKLKTVITSQQQFTTNSPISSQVDSLINDDCNAVVVVATAVDVGGIVGAFAQKNADITLIGLSPLWIPEANLRMTGEARTYAQEHLWIVSAGAKWGDTTTPGMAKMLNDIAAHNDDQESNPFFLYGYSQAWAMDLVLEQAAKNGDLSSKGVLRALSNVGTFDFQGLLPAYEFGPNTKTRVVPNANTIFKYDSKDPSKLVPVADDAVDFASEFSKDYEY